MPDPTAQAGAPAMPAPIGAPAINVSALQNLKSSAAAIALIVREEDSGAAYYTRHYEHFDWPEGASGPTVGIGYDCGYVTGAELVADWTGVVPDATVAAMVKACGVRGEAAGAWVRAHGAGVTITWDQAMAEFTGREMPKWESRLRQALPNAELLPGDCFGALLSIGYNRGTAGFLDPGPRYSEMRAIRAFMMAKDFAAIPAEILSMRRLWPAGGDLWRRRVHEAELFAAGLKAA